MIFYECEACGGLLYCGSGDDIERPTGPCDKS